MFSPQLLAAGLLVGLAFLVRRQVPPVLVTAGGALAIVGDAGLAARKEGDRQPLAPAIVSELNKQLGPD